MHYTQSDYIYWKCPTNNQYTAERCPNNTIIREEDLIQALSDYLHSVIADPEKLAEEIAVKYGKQLDGSPQTADVKTLEAKKVKAQKKLEKFMDMYANDIISMQTLKEKSETIKEEIERINDQLLVAKGQQAEVLTAEKIAQMVTEEIQKFLSLESATNQDLRRIIDCITVSSDKHITIQLKSSQPQ